MKRYEVDQLRNVVMLGGSRAGKTSLAEALLSSAETEAARASGAAMSIEAAIEAGLSETP